VTAISGGIVSGSQSQGSFASRRGRSADDLPEHNDRVVLHIVFLHLFGINHNRNQSLVEKKKG
jgi:hypothetical protein